MEFWDGVYKKASEAANYTAKETERLAEIAKIKFNLMREKCRLEEAYKVLGEVYYLQMKSGEVDENAISIAYDKIEKSIVETARLNDLLSSFKTTKFCCECGTKIDKEMVYCPKCGTKQFEDVEEEVSSETPECNDSAEETEASEE